MRFHIKYLKYNKLTLHFFKFHSRSSKFIAHAQSHHYEDTDPDSINNGLRRTEKLTTKIF